MKICAADPMNSEYSLCGNAFDAPDDPLCNTEAFRFVKPGERMTCPDCRRVIREIRETYPRGFVCKG